MSRRRKPPTMAQVDQQIKDEQKRACEGGYHHFGGWRTDDDGRAYWDCAHGCGHRHRRDDLTAEEEAAEQGCYHHREWKRILQARAAREATDGDA